ncbi:hypothetical protein [Nitrospira sp. Ecomares 2.1]
MIANLSLYPTMKDSGLPWVGEIPAHWDLLPNRAFLRRRKILVGERHSDYELLSLTKAGVIVRDISTMRGKFSTDMGTSQEVRVGDFVFCLFDVPETPRTVGLSEHNGMITGAYTILECRNSQLARFVEAFYIAMDDRKLLSPLYSGLRNTIPPSTFLGIKTPVPPSSEQLAIVRFLDHYDRKIRRYIRAKQKLINLLEEEKQAIIHHAVTRGLDSNVRLKPSGVDWLGDVPEHWEVLRGKYVGRLYSTPSVLDNELTEDSVGNSMYLKVSDLGAVDDSLRLTHSRLYVKRSLTRRSTRRSLLVFPKRGGAIYTNRVALVDLACLVDPNLMCWEISERFDPHYVALLLKTRTLADLADVSSVPQINNHHINPIPFPAPPVDEQIAIVAGLAVNLSGLKSAISRVEREIELLREYRITLIADVVTGKLDVRGVAAQLQDESVEPEIDELREEVEEQGDIEEETDFDDIAGTSEEAILAD